MSGEGGDGDLLGERGHGTLEMCSTAVHLERGLLLRKWNLEVKVVTLRRRETETEDLEVVEIVEGECLRLGVSLTSSRVWTRGNRCMKEGMGGSRGGAG